MKYGGKISIVCGLLAAFALSYAPAATAQKNTRMASATKPQTANTARDGDIAIREEFDLLAARNTVEAMELFVARHPGHALSQQAAEKIRLYLSGTKTKQ